MCIRAGMPHFSKTVSVTATIGVYALRGEIISILESKVNLWAIIISLRFQLCIMGVKTITVREEAYKLLLEMKKEKESFSDVLVRVLRKKTARKSRVMDFFGVLKDSKNLEEMEKEILEQRKKSELRDVCIKSVHKINFMHQNGA